MPKALLNGLQCPTCLVGEKHPNVEGWLLIRARVLWQDGQWLSHCLVCAGLWDKHLQPSLATYDEKKGWFRC